MIEFYTSIIHKFCLLYKLSVMNVKYYMGHCKNLSARKTFI